MKRNFFVPITKVDATLKQVWGTAAVEQVDKSGEILDYTTSKPYFEQWSNQHKAVTMGKSLGNVREMHQLSAVGKVIAIDFDDAAKAVKVGVEIVDDAAWAKVEKGVYTGFSLGGKLVGKKKYDDTVKAVRYTVAPVEISVVDDPCIGDATFELVKATGSEIVKFTVEKIMLDVSDLANHLASLRSLQSYIKSEAEWEADGSPLPAAFASWVAQGCELLKLLCEEECEELVESMGKASIASFLKVASKLSLKADAYATIKTHAESVVQSMTALMDGQQEKPIGADDMDEKQVKAVVSDEVTKSVEAAVAKAIGAVNFAEIVEKAVAPKLEEISKASASALEIAEETAKTVAHVFGQPEAPKVAANGHAVSKVDDNAAAGETPATSPEKASATELIKAAHANGGQPYTTFIRK